jgi:hypothetical protein
MSIIGTRGATGKKTVNASTNFAKFFDESNTDRMVKISDLRGL